MPPAIHTRSPSPLARVADAARELGWSLRHLAAHLFGKVGHRYCAWRCASRIRSAERDIEEYEQQIKWARNDLEIYPLQIAFHQAEIARLQRRKEAHEAQA